MATALGIDQFLRRLARQQRFGRVLGILRNHGLVIVGLLLLIELLQPTALLPALALSLAWLACWILASLRQRLQLVGADRSFDFKDELVTWRATEQRQRGSAMFSWLVRSLEKRIVALPPDLARRVSRRPLGPLRYLLPLVILLLMLRLFAPMLPPLPEGMIQLSNRGSAGIAAAGGESAEGGEQAEAGEGEQGEEADANVPPPPNAEPEEEQDPSEGEEPTLPPKALIDDTGKDESFLLPSFIGEGESRPSQVPVAAIDEVATSGQSQQTSMSSAGPLDELSEQDFERALERAVRSRHVPEDERPFVRRYFEALMRRGR